MSCFRKSFAVVLLASGSTISAQSLSVFWGDRRNPPHRSISGDWLFIERRGGGPANYQLGAVGILWCGAGTSPVGAGRDRTHAGGTLDIAVQRYSPGARYCGAPRSAASSAGGCAGGRQPFEREHEGDINGNAGGAGLGRRRNVSQIEPCRRVEPLPERLGGRGTTPLTNTLLTDPALTNSWFVFQYSQQFPDRHQWRCLVTAIF